MVLLSTDGDAGPIISCNLETRESRWSIVGGRRGPEILLNMRASCNDFSFPTSRRKRFPEAFVLLH